MANDVLPCPEQWSGSLSDFISTYTLPNWFLPDRALRLHRELLAYVKEGSVFFSRNLTGGGGPRGTKVTGFPEPYRLYASDNAPALWVYTQLRSGEELSVADAITRKALPLREPFGSRPGEAAYEWSSSNPDPLNLRGRSPKGKRWKLCHLYSVSEGLGDDVEWQKKRFLRLVHPFNLFLFPRPATNGAGYYSLAEDLGEDFRACQEVSERIRTMVGDVAWSEFLTAAGIVEGERPGRLDALSTSIDLVLHYQERKGGKKKETPAQRVPQSVPLPPRVPDVAAGRAGQVALPAGSLVVRAKRMGEYENLWDGSLLRELHTHQRIKNVIQRAAEAGNAIFVQDQDRMPRQITSVGFVHRIDALPDGTYRVLFDRPEACSFPGCNKQPPGYYYAD